MEFDVTKEYDPEYLIKYYKSRIKRWENNPKAKKIVEHYKKGIKKLEQNLTPNTIERWKE